MYKQTMLHVKKEQRVVISKMLMPTRGQKIYSMFSNQLHSQAHSKTKQVVCQDTKMLITVIDCSKRIVASIKKL